MLIGCLSFDNSFSQSRSFEKAIEKGNFGKAERLVKKKIREYKNGVEFFNVPANSKQVSFVAAYDSIVNWLMLHKGVKDATWDKCQNKVAIYPGASTIGIVFQMKNDVVEKCYRVQEGTTGQPNIFGWRPAMFKPKMKLIFKGSSDCTGFIQKQKRLCEN